MNKIVEVVMTNEQEQQFLRQAEKRGVSLQEYFVLLAQKDRLRLRRKRDKYRINYGRGVEKARISTLEKAMQKADVFAARTGKTISIEKNNVPVAFRQWCKGSKGLDKVKDPIVFGNRGYYADWVVLE
ncbi:MAG: hypothetical protein GX245_07170 [Eubacteriaceae bacterium]|jgi:hypothetical protein|nr:hypothetical protein [Eubacteriaceae bacterium]